MENNQQKISSLRKRYISKEQCLVALRNSTSFNGAAIYLGVTYGMLKPFLKEYKDEVSGLTLYEIFKTNPSDKKPKPPKIISENTHKNKINYSDIFERGIRTDKFRKKDLYKKFIELKYAEDKCKFCGYDDSRIIDGKKPLMINFIDGNKNNWIQDNVEIICLNCFYVKIDDIAAESRLRHDLNISSRQSLNYIEDIEIKDVVKEDEVEDDLYKYVTRNKLDL